MKCPNCDFDCPAEMRFCGMCGASLTFTCPECQFVNPVTYRFCGMCGKPLLHDSLLPPRPAAAPRAVAQSSAPADLALSALAAGSGALPLTGERRVATIIFADVKGSTELLEQMGTEAWVEVMNNLFQVLETEIYRYGGEVGQFRGDGLVAMFGAKSANENDPEHAVLAALAMQEAIKPYAAAMAQKEGIELTMRVGVNTGEIIVASVGDSTQYSEDTAMGDALAVAARMETAAEPGTVLISESTYRLAYSQFDWLPLGEIMVKGYSHPFSVYRPLAVRKSSELSQDVQTFGLAHGLIGRKTEFQSLKKCIEDLHSGRGGIVLVTGMKGMGKTFLVDQVRQHFIRQNALLASVQNKDLPNSRVEDEPLPVSRPIRWLHGRSRSYGHLRPYSMWLDLLHEWLGTHPEDQASEVQKILRAHVELQMDSEVEREYPNLTTFLSASSEETTTERLRHMDAEGLKRLFFQTISEWIHELAQRGPIVISFADVHWADSSSLELLNFCLPLCDAYPILWLLVYRPERDSPIWSMQHQFEKDFPHRLTQMDIPPLSKAENQEFIRQFLGPESLYPETLELILKKSEGNPYFVKELIYSLVAKGALVRDSEQNVWRQTREVTSLELPDSLQSLLMARIDRLQASERRVLQMAAVVGSIFWVNALQALAGQSMPLAQLQADLVTLQRTGIIHERAYVDDLGMEYAFDSSLIREVAYESLLNTQRVSYHLRVAEFLEEIVFREGKRRYFNTLAHHYRLAGDVKKELFYTLQAAERAQSIYANAEALHYYTRALELLDQIEEQNAVNGHNNSHQHYAILTQKFESLNGRRAIHFLMGNVEAGWADSKALLPLARQMEQDPTWLIDALLQQPGVASIDSREELEQGIPMALEALELAQKTGDQRRQMNALLAIASQRNLINDPTWIEVGDRALQLAHEIGDRQYEAMILLGLGHAYVGRDELQKGMEYLNAALPICQELDNRVTEITLLRVLGAQYERSGDNYRRLVDYEQKRLQIAREIGDRFEEGNALMFCGQIRALNLGDLESGLALMREALRILSAVSGKIFPLLRIAQAQIMLGQFEDAQQTIDDARPVAERNVFDLGRVGLRLVTILLYNALADETHLRLALEIAEEIILMEVNQLVSRQYRMAAACEASASYLGLARLSSAGSKRREYNRRALEMSQIALDVYNTFGYVNVIECSCEEIYFRYGQALAANGKQAQAAEYLEMAYAEMMRKYELIPIDSHFRRSYLENLTIHREIRAAHTAASRSKSAIARAK